MKFFLFFIVLSNLSFAQGEETRESTEIQDTQDVNILGQNMTAIFSLERFEYICPFQLQDGEESIKMEFYVDTQTQDGKILKDARVGLSFSGLVSLGRYIGMLTKVTETIPQECKDCFVAKLFFPEDRVQRTLSFASNQDSANTKTYKLTVTPGDGELPFKATCQKRIP